MPVLNRSCVSDLMRVELLCIISFANQTDLLVGLQLCSTARNVGLAINIISLHTEAGILSQSDTTLVPHISGVPRALGQWSN